MDTTNLSFGDALTALKSGHKVARSGWNGKGMYVLLVGCTHDPLYSRTVPVEEVSIEDFIAMYTATGTYNAWLASQTDILANDWQIIKGGDL